MNSVARLDDSRTEQHERKRVGDRGHAGGQRDEHQAPTMGRPSRQLAWVRANRCMKGDRLALSGMKPLAGSVLVNTNCDRRCGRTCAGPSAPSPGQEEAYAR